MLSAKTLPTIAMLLLFAGIIAAPKQLEASLGKPNQATNQQLEAIYQVWSESPKVAINVETTGAPETRAYARGPEDALVTVVEYSDFECLFCRKTSPKFKQLLAKYPNKTRLIYKNFPLDPSCNKLIKNDIHKYACKAARAVRCAGVQSNDLFWLVHDQLFSYESFDDDVFSEISTVVGTKGNESAFSECLAANNDVGLEAEIEEATRVNIVSTPSIFVNGRKIPRFSIEAIELIIKKLEAGS